MIRIYKKQEIILSLMIGDDNIDLEIIYINSLLRNIATKKENKAKKNTRNFFHLQDRTISLALDQ